MLALRRQRAAFESGHGFSHQRTFEYAFVVTSSNPPATVAALIDSLRYDPFYVTITEEFADSEARRRQALARCFDYSMSEGARKGWYLSIIGVTPSAQGQGIGKRLIEPTLAEADDAG